ncbi:hypothetical protein GCM10023075_47930 [Streptosporangium album]
MIGTGASAVQFVPRMRTALTLPGAARTLHRLQAHPSLLRHVVDCLRLPAKTGARALDVRPEVPGFTTAHPVTRPGRPGRVIPRSPHAADPAPGAPVAAPGNAMTE